MWFRYRCGMQRDHAERDRGCEYCADDANMFFGHVEQVASNEATRRLLMRCPRCGSFYEVTPAGPAHAARLTQAEAAARFPS
jgi:hypothetical protein